MLHGFGTQVNAQLLQLTGFAVLESKHVQDTNESICCMAYRVVEHCHRLVGFFGSRCPHSGSMMTGQFMMNGLIRSRAHGS